MLLQRKAALLNKETGSTSHYTEYDTDERRLSRLLATAFARPFRLLLTEPIIQVVSVYQTYTYGLLYIFLSSFPTLWTRQYGESIGISGLNYISLGIGFFVGSQFCAPMQDKVYGAMKRRNNGVGKPEFRVPLMFIGASVTPLGVFIYGWTSQYKTHWIGPNIGAFLFAAGNIVIFQCQQTYVLDSYTRFAASGIAAAVVMRSCAGFGFPLFAPYLFSSLGYGWGNSLLGFIAVFLGIPAPLVFWMYGERLRARSKFAAANVSNS